MADAGLGLWASLGGAVSWMLKRQCLDRRVAGAPMAGIIIAMSEPMADFQTHDRDPWSIFLVFLRLGLSCFGGPVAHLGYFRQEFVARRRWLDERGYADLVALCQFLPVAGPCRFGSGYAARRFTGQRGLAALETSPGDRFPAESRFARLAHDHDGLKPDTARAPHWPI